MVGSREVNLRVFDRGQVQPTVKREEIHVMGEVLLGICNLIIRTLAK